MWGLSTYRPYQLLGIAGRCAVVVAVWALSRRLGVRGWIAVVVVAPLIFLGVGRVNILFGFQVTMTRAYALSLAHLLLADHDGPWWRAGRTRGSSVVAQRSCAPVWRSPASPVWGPRPSHDGAPGGRSAHGPARRRLARLAPGGPTAAGSGRGPRLTPRPSASSSPCRRRRSAASRYEVFAYALGALAVVGVVAAIRWQRSAPGIVRGLGRWHPSSGAWRCSAGVRPPDGIPTAGS